MQRFADGGDYDDQEVSELEGLLQDPRIEVRDHFRLNAAYFGVCVALFLLAIGLFHRDVFRPMLNVAVCRPSVSASYNTSKWLGSSFCQQSRAVWTLFNTENKKSKTKPSIKYISGLLVQSVATAGRPRHRRCKQTFVADPFLCFYSRFMSVLVPRRRPACCQRWYLTRPRRACTFPMLTNISNADISRGRS